jgi:hypothetical protein
MTGTWTSSWFRRRAAFRDPQLEKGVEVVMESLKKNPLPTHKKPAYPDYQKGKGREAKR